MRIGIEAQRLFRKKKHGMDIVALELIKALQKLDTPHQFVVFVKPDEDDTVIQPTHNFEIVKVEGGPYPIWEQVKLPAAAKKHNIDVLHCTANTAPLKSPVPLVITLHDIIYLEKINLSQGTWYQRIGNLYRRWNVPKVVKTSKAIATVSNYERQRILDHFGLPPERVTTVYNAVGSHFKPIEDEMQLQAIRLKYKLPHSYMFFLGNTDPKKNVYGVMAALKKLKEENKLPLPLVMPDLDREYLHRILQELKATHLTDNIVTCGYIPNHELPGIISNATMFLYPSLRESFGIPLLEAMACGVPVITSNTSSMPEVAADAALFIDPFRPETLAEKIELLMNNPTLCTELKNKGLQRAQQFSWENTARQMLQLYESI